MRALEVVHELVEVWDREAAAGKVLALNTKRKEIVSHPISIRYIRRG